MLFPHIVTKNLNNETIDLPGDLPAQYTFIIIYYTEEQQSQTDAWISTIENLKTTYPNIDWLRLNALNSVNPLQRWWHNLISTVTTTNPLVIRKTLKIFTNIKKLNAGIGVEQLNSSIQIILVNRAGKIVWRIEGEKNPQREQTLIEMLPNILQEQNHEIK